VVVGLAAALVTGLLTHMQPPWYYADFGSCVLAALLILVFWPKQAAPAARA